MTVTPYALADVPDGWVGWIRGRIVDGATMLAPLSSRRCAYYHLLAKGEHEHAAAAQEASSPAITIEDGTGRAIVEPAGGFVHVDYDVVSVYSAGELLTRLGVPGPYLLHEGVLEVGQWITVHGRCLRDVDRDPRRVADYRSGPPSLIRVGRGARVKLWVSEVE